MDESSGRRLLPRVVQLLFWIALAFVAVGTSAAQESTSIERIQEGSEAAREAMSEPQALRVSEIPSRAEVALAYATEIQFLAQAEADVVEIEALLPEVVALLDAAYAQFEQLNLDLAVVRRIRDLSQVWSRHQASLLDAQEILVPRREELQARMPELGNLRAMWERTRDSLAGVELPEGVGERITEVLEELSAARERLEGRLAELLTLETRVSEQLQRANQVVRQLDAAEATARARLLTRDTVPLWAFVSSVTEESLLEQATDSYYGSTEALQQFLTEETDSFALHVTYFLVLVVVLGGLARWSVRWQVESESLERAKFVLSKPISSAFLLALFATSFIYDPVPDVVRELALILTLIPVLRLVPGIFRPDVRPGLYRYLGVFFFAHILQLIPEGSPLFRLVLLVVAFAAMAIMIWLLRRPPWPDIEDLSSGWRAARRLLQLAALLLGLAAVANVLGWLRLAFHLVAATFYSAYGAILIYALWATLTGVLAALPFTPVANRLHSLKLHGSLIVQRASRVIAFFGLLLWLRATVIFFDIYQPIYQMCVSALTASVTVGALSISLGKVIAVLLILWVARLFARFARFVMEAEVFPRLGLGVGEADAAATLTHYVIGAIAVVGAAAALGVTGTQLAVLVGALGVGIGFGLQNIVNNFISGLILIFERPIKVGDVVEVGQLLGTVKRIGIRASIVRTFDGAEVVVPNGDLIAKEVINWTLSDQMRRRELRLGVAYGTEPEQVIELLSQVVDDHPMVLDDPEAMILFEGFSEGTMQFSLRYWVPIAGSLQVASEVAVGANKALREAGIKIPVPQREIVVRSAEDEQKTGQQGPPEPQ